MSQQVLAIQQVVEPRIVSLAKKVLNRLGLWMPRDLDAAATNFIAVNSRYWPRVDLVPRGRVLIEGHLAEYGPNYLFRTALAAKALQESAQLEIDVVFNGFPGRWMLAKRVYRSFGITNFIFLGSRYFTSNIARRILGWSMARRVMRTLDKPEDILGIAYGEIKVGDLIYDDILKTYALKTISSIDGRVAEAIRKSYYYYLQYLELFRQHRYRCYVSTHTTYSEYGILCRVALAHGVKVIETTDTQMACHEGIADDNLPTYHSGIKRAIEEELKTGRASADSLYATAEDALKRRLNSQVKQLDTDKAFRGKVYSRSELCNSLSIAEDQKIVFVLAHIFTDSPHLSTALYPDYYQWLAKSLKVCAGVPEVMWIVKPHPTGDFYGEKGVVEELIAEVNASNVKLCPPDLNTRSLVTCADALITVYGTAGLEFACVGIPIVLAGKPFYSEFGFTIDSETIDEYEHELRALKNAQPLSESQRRRAVQIFGIWERQFDWDNPIVTVEVLANVWGNERPRNLRAAYEIMTRNLGKVDPRQTRLWAFAQSVVNAN